MESCKGPLCAFFFLVPCCRSLTSVASDGLFQKDYPKAKPWGKIWSSRDRMVLETSKPTTNSPLHYTYWCIWFIFFFFVRFWLLSGGNSQMKRVTFRPGSRQRRHFTATNHRLHLKSFHHWNKNPGKIARENGYLPFFCFWEIKPFPQKGNRQQTIISTSWYSRYLNSQL